MIAIIATTDLALADFTCYDGAPHHSVSACADFLDGVVAGALAATAGFGADSAVLVLVRVRLAL